MKHVLDGHWQTAASGCDDSGMYPGLPVRLHDLEGNDMGVAHVPPPIEIGDLIALQHSEHRVYDVVPAPPGALIAALVKAEPIRLRVVPQ